MKLSAASNLFKFTYVLLIPIRAMFSKLLLDINQFRTELKPYLKFNWFFVKTVFEGILRGVFQNFNPLYGRNLIENGS